MVNYLIFCESSFECIRLELILLSLCLSLFVSICLYGGCSLFVV